MGMRSDEDPSRIEVKIGSSEDQEVVIFRHVPMPKFYRRDSGNDEWTEDDADNPNLIKEIVKSVKSDFVRKCIVLLETCTTIPDSLYTYDVFRKMFCFNQEGDVCASSEDKVYKFTISDASDLDDIVRRIVQGYVKRNAKYCTGNDEDDLVIKDLIYNNIAFDQSKEDLVRRMFGGGEFPFLCVKYAWHPGRKEWHYVYYITR